MRKLMFTGCAALAMAIVASPAFAQDDDRRTSVSLGLGVTEFAGESMDDVTDVGGALDLRVMFGSGRGIGLETAYFGTRQSVDALGLDDDARLVSHALEASARFDISDFFDFNIREVELLPFVTVGASVGRYNVNGGSTASLADTDNVLFIPASAGLAASFDTWLFDARFTWRQSFDEDLLRTGGGRASDASLNNWNITARAGLEF